MSDLSRVSTNGLRGHSPRSGPRDTELYMGAAGVVSEVLSGARAPSLRLYISFKRANSLPVVPISVAQRQTCPDLATLPHCSAHQTSMPHGIEELPEHVHCGRTAVNHTLPATLVQGGGC